MQGSQVISKQKQLIIDYIRENLSPYQISVLLESQHAQSSKLIFSA